MKLLSHNIHEFAVFGALLASAASLFGCAPKTASSTSLKLAGCSATLSSQTSWTPNVTGSGAANHDSAVTVSQQVYTASAPITGYAQPAPGAQEVTFTIPMVSDLGTYGSLQLAADITTVTGGISAAYPMLVYLADNAGHEFINLARAGTNGDCAASGYFTSWPSASSYPTSNANCTTSWPSAYFNYYHWRERQLALPSVNTFPTCNWSSGTSTSSASDPECAFNTNFLVNGKLSFGGNYTAKYVVITSDRSTVSGATANMKLTVTRKTDASLGGAVDLNVILVGNSVINASRTDQGKLNLNTAFTAAQNLYSGTNTQVKFGTIRVFEWDCSSGGDAYSSLDSAQLSQMFLDGGAAIGSTGSGTSVNLYLISSFSDNSGILGISGAIGGPAVNGTASSGVAVATFGQLASWNPNCSGSSCPVTSWQSDFNDFVGTLAHETGHYLGLNHPSESAGTVHDFVQDTPVCSYTSASSGYITIGSCLNYDTNVFAPTGKTCSQACTSYNSTNGVFCPAVQECEFNHLMWWSSKFFKQGAGTGDGNMISAQSGKIVNYSPLIQ